jgi:RNA-directed DNA polymerase
MVWFWRLCRGHRAWHARRAKLRNPGGPPIAHCVGLGVQPQEGRDQQEGVRSSHSTPRRENRSHVGAKGNDGSGMGKGTTVLRSIQSVTWSGTRNGKTMQHSLNGIANRARSHRKHRFGNLCGELNEAYLADCYRHMNPKAASGVDRVSHRAYGEALSQNLHKLVERLKAGSYRARLVRRRHIPKGKGKTRPLGILVTEDKVVQTGAARLLSAIWEADFLDCSNAYRPKRNAHKAIRALSQGLQFGKFGYVVEADVKDYFGSIRHDWLIRMLEERIKDRAFLRLIRKWLKAQILEEDGTILDPATGTPQGGVVSAVLANVYLHYVLDLWFEWKVKKHCRGQAMVVRYADDFVCAFQYESDARWFYEQLPQRLGKFGLTLAAEKTRILRFSRFEPTGKNRFEFLGFEFRWGRSRKGKPIVKRRTAPKRLTRAVARFSEWLRANRHRPLPELMKTLRSKYHGTWNYYGLIGNGKSLQAFYHWTLKLLHKWLNRRSQRAGMRWNRLQRLLRVHHIPRPHVTESYSGHSQLEFRWNWC